MPGDGLEALGDGFLRGHAACHREFQVREVVLPELFVFEERVIERVDRRDPGEFLMTDDHHDALGVARIGDQDVAPAQSHEDHRIHGERIDVIERQRCEHGFDVAGQLPLRPDLGLQQVGDDVLMREHGALGDAGGAACVLQERQIATARAHRRQGPVIADGERVEQMHGLRQTVLRHHLFDVPQHEIEQTSLQVQPIGEQIAETGDDHVLHARAGQRVLDGLREVLEHDDGLRAAVLELVCEFAHGVERIHVDDHRASLQDTEQRDWILERVRQHDGDALARFDTDALQICRECGGLARQFAIGEVGTNAHIRDPLAELRGAFVEELHDRLVLPHVDFVRHVRWIRGVPDAVGVRRTLHRSGFDGWNRRRLGRLVHCMSPEAQGFFCVCLCAAVSIPGYCIRIRL